ncbi:IPT/TIG domain-containing protein [Aeromicrobium sp. PE09-221]|uniref:IPT/TIG domain-containing protein n=1 Tax=Aeromicrobium sp. PE09-221 TaxID=1898043 RepID=UPI001482EDAF|nr:IPT/TIG domain-containing protein [Aeromicrobium sp. PE09-221]
MLSAVAIPLLFLAPASARTVVDRPVTPLTMMFGSVVEAGHVFTPPANQDVLSEITITAGSYEGERTSVSVHEWDATTGQAIGEPLFESAPLTFTSTGTMETHTIAVPALVVNPTGQYVLSFRAERIPYVLDGGFVWRFPTADAWTAIDTVGLAYGMVFHETPAVSGLSPSSGLPGTAVSVTGTGFEDTTEVLFGDTVAEFTVESDTEILVTVPQLPAGTVPVRVASDGLISADVPAAQFTVTMPPEPTPPPSPGGEAPAEGDDTTSTGLTLPSVGAMTPLGLLAAAVAAVGAGLTLFRAGVRADTGRSRS